MGGIFLKSALPGEEGSVRSGSLSLAHLVHGLGPTHAMIRMSDQRPSVKLYTLFFHSTNIYCASTLYYSRHGRYCREQKKSHPHETQISIFFGHVWFDWEFSMLCGCQFVEIFAVHIIYLKIFNIIFNNCKNSLLTVVCCL